MMCSRRPTMVNGCSRWVIVSKRCSTSLKVCPMISFRVWLIWLVCNSVCYMSIDFAQNKIARRPVVAPSSLLNMDLRKFRNRAFSGSHFLFKNVLLMVCGVSLRFHCLAGLGFPSKPYFGLHFCAWMVSSNLQGPLPINVELFVWGWGRRGQGDG